MFQHGLGEDCLYPEGQSGKAYNKSKKDIEDEAKRLDDQVKALREKYKTLTSEINKLNASVINTGCDGGQHQCTPEGLWV